MAPFEVQHTFWTEYLSEVMNTVSLNHLWGYLQGLSLTASNQRWLGERLIEASTTVLSLTKTKEI